MQISFPSFYFLLSSFLASVNLAAGQDRYSIDKTLEKCVSIEVSNQLKTAVKDLEFLVKMNDPRFAIKINEHDLKQEGITRNSNEQFTQYKDNPVSSILTAIVRVSNPILAVKDLSDDEQQVVWVVENASDDKDTPVIVITTRQSAKRHGYKLPALFENK